MNGAVQFVFDIKVPLIVGFYVERKMMQWSHGRRSGNE